MTSRVKGQIAVGLMGAISLVTFTASTLVGYYSGELAAAKRAGEQDVKIQANTTNIENFKEQLSEVKADTNELNKKIDALLLRQGINPLTIK